MLSIAKCRAILGKNANLGDDELKILRAQLYDLALVVTEHPAPHLNNDASASSAQSDLGHLGFDDLAEMFPPEERGQIEERVAIREYDGGCDSATAEKAAIIDHARARRN